MDRVRFGRALGYGARHAAKAALKAVDAATSPGPEKPQGQRTAAGSRADGPASTVGEVAAAYRRVNAVKDQARDEAKIQLKKSVWAPVKKFSSVVWLQVTGLFFGLFAMVMGGAAWSHRQNFRLPVSDPAAQHVYFFAAVFLVFAWFTVSNFVRAAKRDRR